MKRISKPFLYLLILMLLFGGFICTLLRPSIQTKAIKELEICSSIEEIKTSYEKYHPELMDDEDYHQAIRGKLKSFKLTHDDILSIKKWLPAKEQNLNIILVPDLSKRIIDNKNNPDQISNDVALLNSIYALFENEVRRKINSKDRIIVDIADPQQGQGKFRSLADSLLFNLSDHKGKSNRIYFNSVKERFHVYIDSLYSLAKQGVTGANYVHFFSDKLQQLVQKSTLEDDFRNIVVLVTDGYLDINKYDGRVCTITPDENALEKFNATKDTTLFRYPTETSENTFPEVEVYLFEVHERQAGIGKHYLGLKKWWTDWFQKMNIKNAQTDFIFKRQNAFDLTRKEVQNILGRN